MYVCQDSAVGGAWVLVKASSRQGAEGAVEMPWWVKAVMAALAGNGVGQYHRESTGFRERQLARGCEEWRSQVEGDGHPWRQARRPEGNLASDGGTPRAMAWGP